MTKALAMPRAIRGVRADASDFTKVAAEIRGTIEANHAAIKKTLDEAKEAHGADLAKAHAEIERLVSANEQAENRISEIEQRIDRARAGGRDERPKSAGEQAVENEALKGFLAKRSQSSVRLEITSPDLDNTLITPQREREIVRPERERMTIRSLLSVGSTSSNSIEYVRQTGFTNNAKFVSEGAQKPYSDLAYDLQTTPVRTLAHMFKVSRQAWDDAAVLRSDIDNEGRYGLDVVEENAILEGDGSGQNLYGLVPQADTYDRAATGDSKLDTILRAKTQIRLNFFEPNGVVLHPADYEEMMLTKASDAGVYVFGDPRSGGEPSPWGMNVVVTTAIDEGDFLIGDFRRAATIYDRMGTEVLVSSENADDFEKNMLTVRIEKRLALAVKRPNAMVTGSF